MLNSPKSLAPRPGFRVVGERGSAICARSSYLILVRYYTGLCCSVPLLPARTVHQSMVPACISCTYHVHSLVLTSALLRTVGLFPAYSSMHDAWQANPIIKETEALLERCGGRGPRICDCDNLISSQSQSRSSEQPNTRANHLTG